MRPKCVHHGTIDLLVCCQVKVNTCFRCFIHVVPITACRGHSRSNPDSQISHSSLSFLYIDIISILKRSLSLLRCPEECFKPCNWGLKLFNYLKLFLFLNSSLMGGKKIILNYFLLANFTQILHRLQYKLKCKQFETRCKLNKWVWILPKPTVTHASTVIHLNGTATDLRKVFWGNFFWCLNFNWTKFPALVERCFMRLPSVLFLCSLGVFCFKNNKIAAELDSAGPCHKLANFKPLLAVRGLGRGEKWMGQLTPTEPRDWPSHGECGGVGKKKMHKALAYW